MRTFQLDVPASYSHEFAVLGIRIAEVFGAKGFLTKVEGRTLFQAVGFEADLILVAQLYESLARQCTLSLGTWFKQWVNRYGGTGSQRWNAKRGFISGFTTGVKEKLTSIRQVAVQDAGHGAQLVLVDRGKQLDGWLSANVGPLRNGKRRSYDTNARVAGRVAGQRADVGQSSVHSGRREIGGR
jgi:hypothetical protein